MIATATDTNTSTATTTDHHYGPADTAATYEAIVEAHYVATYRYARSLVFNEADAQDLTQHAFLKLKTNFHQIRDLDRVKGWLFSTARRKFISGYRHQSKFPKVTLDATDSYPAPSVTSAETRVDARKALEGLHQLPEKFRAPLALFYLEQWSYKEISEHLDMPIGTVMSRLSRGKAQLKDWMETSPQAA